MVTPRYRKAIDDDVGYEELAPLAPKAGLYVELRSKLVIDKDKLDDCLAEHAELFLQVADAYSFAVARRDDIKHEIEVTWAEEADKLREDAARAKEKMTKDALNEQLELNPRIIRLKGEQRQAEKLMGTWGPLKESYQQRSYMLRELGPVYVGRLFGSNSMRFGGDIKQQVAERVVEATGPARREERRRRLGE